MKKEIRIILTSIGGLVAPSIIEHLRKSAEEDNKKLFIIGINAQKNAVGSFFVDKNFIVPNGDSVNYIPTLFKIAKENKIDIIIPCSDEELLSISKEKKNFMKDNIMPICSNYDIIHKSNDKGLMLQYLKKYKIPYPKFCIPKNIEEVVKFSRAVEYPHKPFIVKPRIARGGRGFRIIKEEFDFLKDRTCNAIKLAYFLDILKKYKKFPNIVLMEYLPGEEFSVDSLAYHGQAIYIMPRKRIKALGGPSIIGETVKNNEIKNMVEKAIRIFGFHLNVNIQLKYSERNIPLIFEINPRISGTIVANDAAGIDLLYYGIKLALGQKIPRQKIMKEIKMLRYFKEIFLDKSK